MHDPLTVVLDIRIPFTGKKNKAGAWEHYPRTFITIWHRDPEKDGTDDSCNWSGYRVPEDLAEKARAMGRREWDFYFDNRLGAPLRFSPDLDIVWAVWRAVDWRIGKKREIRSARDIAFIMDLVANPTDNINQSVSEARATPEGMGHLFFIVLRCYLRYTRPWWKHPRLHFWHYRIQVNPLQDFKRWAFSRCQGCGKRFPWGYSPTSTQWESSGPLWFKSERNTYHSECVPAPYRVEKVTSNDDSLPRASSLG